MVLLLALEEEIVCLIILTFILIFSFCHRKAQENLQFRRMNLFAICHLAVGILLTAATEQTLQPGPFQDHLFNGVFYLFAILFCYRLFCYTAHFVYHGPAMRRLQRGFALAPIFYVVLFPFLHLPFFQDPSMVRGYEICSRPAYALVVLLSCASLVVLFLRWKGFARRARWTLLAILLGFLAIIPLQISTPELFFTASAVTVITAALFFSLENPIDRYREHAFYDLAAGIPNRNRYSMDMLRLDTEYGTQADQLGFACVSCDMNSLKAINDSFGHETGDYFIRLTAQILQQYLVSAAQVYRTGGDEFVATYAHTDEGIIYQEIQAVREACLESILPNGRPLSLALGYTFAAPGETVFQAAKRADQLMYEDKAQAKKGEDPPR